MTTIQIFQILKPRLGERETEALVEFVGTKVNENNKEMHGMNLKTLATKEDHFVLKEDIAGVKGDIAGVKGDIAAVRVEIVTVRGEIATVRGEIAGVRSELKEEIAALRLEFKSEIARLEIKMGEIRSDLMRWMFGLFVTLMLAILGLYFKH